MVRSAIVAEHDSAPADTLASLLDLTVVLITPLGYRLQCERGADHMVSAPLVVPTASNAAML